MKSESVSRSWVCETCGETISEDNFWTHPHKRYRGIE